MVRIMELPDKKLYVYQTQKGLEFDIVEAKSVKEVNRVNITTPIIVGKQFKFKKIRLRVEIVED